MKKPLPILKYKCAYTNCILRFETVKRRYQHYLTFKHAYPKTETNNIIGGVQGNDQESDGGNIMEIDEEDVNFEASPIQDEIESSTLEYDINYSEHNTFTKTELYSVKLKEILE
ncbi:hypothetical protein INT46_008622 [Mucor plumbeus]|uniref:C2H2-type domain-containing protein n=1 Tax=Mucor plumbeus TaxID=97098 RepID=A0A8H7UTC7_9FUNG|nr:hypothetical protein INT46_008622 [Mucor plumbeus]